MKPIRLAMLGIIAAGTLCGRVSTMAAPASIPSKLDADSSLVTIAGGLAASALPRGPLLLPALLPALPLPLLAAVAAAYTCRSVNAGLLARR
jgi:hypothetical protein